MVQVITQNERRTSVDEIFEELHEQIVTLQLKPGNRISEAEIATRFSVSRQPVRDAFSRLVNLDLLLIRPQRATEVKRFSMRQIEKSRFIRSAIETEVLRRAAVLCNPDGEAQLKEALDEQSAAGSMKDADRFGQLDYQFHEILCGIAKVEYAFEIILAEKAKVDRLCMLGFEKEQRLPELIDDHKKIADAVIAHDEDSAIAAGLKHLARLDSTIERITATNANYFENTSS